MDIRPDHLAIVQGILRDYLPVGVKVWVFGSRANWTTKDSSDLDLALESESRLNHKLLAALKDAFEDSTLPYTVDIVDLNRIGDSFRQIVESQRVPLPVEADGTKQQVPLNTSLIGRPPAVERRSLLPRTKGVRFSLRNYSQSQSATAYTRRRNSTVAASRS